MTRSTLVLAYLLAGAAVCVALVWADHHGGQRLLPHPRGTDYLLALSPAMLVLWPALLPTLAESVRRHRRRTPSGPHIYRA